MKHLRLVALVVTMAACGAWMALAGGAGKVAKGAAAGDCCGAKMTTAAANACPATAACPAGSAQCTAAQREACAKGMKGAKTTSAANGCAMHGTTTAAAAGSCTMHGKTTMAAGTCGAQNAAGGKCDMAGVAQGGCAMCADAMSCDDDVRGLSAHSQVVALRNGVMIVYTAETPENVRALQASLARHNEQVMNALASNSDASLCGGCKPFRGAMASGKFSRELVNVKSGAQILLTSSDRAIVQRIHDMTGAMAARTKS